MNIIEIIAVTFTLLSVFLTVKGNILCWPMGLIGVTFYSIIFYQHSLFADLFLQGVFFVQSVIGWINWKKPKSELPISWIKAENRGRILNFLLLTYMVVFIITSELGGHMPFLDSAVTTLGIMATFLLIKKKIEAWILWIINDVLIIILFSMNGLDISSYVYFIFLILATTGLIRWIKNSKMA